VNPLLQQFIQEARDLLQDIGTRLLELETQPDSSELMTELFRYVHTLKGNSGLFEFPEMTRVLHAGEDLMDAVRRGGRCGIHKHWLIACWMPWILSFC
jgi:two-component system chemotaxis sensor kinase CheA